MKIIQRISIAIGATNGLDNWSDLLDKLEKECLPSGSGFDAGTTIDRELSSPQKIVFHTSFHHMSEHGYYIKWTEHKVVVTPCFDGFDVVVKGRNYRDIKDYIEESFDYALNAEPSVKWDAEARKYVLGVNAGN